MPGVAVDGPRSGGPRRRTADTVRCMVRDRSGRRVPTRGLSVASVSCAALAVLAVVDPFHLRHGAAYSAVLVLAALLLLTALAVRVLPGRLLTVASGVVGGFLVAAWLGLIALTLAFAGPQAEQVVATGGESGRVSLVLVRGHAFEATVFSVRLRAGGGPFAQESTVWQGLGDAPPPARFVFSGPRAVATVSAGSCGDRSTFDRTTLTVDPVHYALRPDGC